MIEQVGFALTELIVFKTLFRILISQFRQIKRDMKNEKPKKLKEIVARMIGL